MAVRNVSGLATIGRDVPGGNDRRPAGIAPNVPVPIPQVRPSPPVAQMQAAAAAVAGFDDRRPDIRPTSGKGTGGIEGMRFNTERTCNPDGQCWQVVAGTKQDREAAAKYNDYLKSQSKNVWETFGDALGDAAGFVKNVAAGVINATIPGSDLGDAGSAGQVLGQLVGTFTNPAGAVLGAVTKGTMAFGAIGKAVSSIGNLVGKANQFLTSPVGQISSTVVGGLVSGMIQPAPNVAYPGAVKTSPLVPNATLYPGYKPQIQTAGVIRGQNLVPIKVQTPVGTVDTTKKSDSNNVVLYIALAAAAALFLFMRKKT